MVLVILRTWPEGGANNWVRRGLWRCCRRACRWRTRPARWRPWTWSAGPAHRAETPVEKIPVDLPGQPHQRVIQVDDPLQGRPKKVHLPIVAWFAHRVSPRPEIGRRRITMRPNRDSQIARKSHSPAHFPANSITASPPISHVHHQPVSSSRTAKAWNRNGVPHKAVRKTGFY